MGHIESERSINCSRRVAFGVLRHAERLKDFSRMTTDVQGPGHLLQVGDTFTQRVEVLGVHLDSEWRVTEMDEPARLRTEGSGPAGSHATVTEELIDEGTGCRVRFSVDYDVPGGLLGETIASATVDTWARKEADAILESLAEVCGGEPST